MKFRPIELIRPIAMIMTLAAVCVQATAQPHSGNAFQAAPPTRPEMRVSMLTCAPGREVYQLEGHTALRLQRDGDDLGRQPYDVVVNWGVFDFASPNFLYRFVKGETDYLAWAYPFDVFMEEYRAEGREVVEQVLDLTPQQCLRLEALVAENIRPENRTYRYNYVLDNCATRPLAMVEAAMGDTISLKPRVESEEATFRSEMANYHANYPWYQFGIDIALGSGIDRPISNRQRTFAPINLRSQLQEATFTAADGSTRPLVTETTILNHGIPGGVTAGPTPLPFSPLGVSVVVFVLTLAFSIRDIATRRLSRWLDTTLYGFFFLAGCLLTFLIFASEHYATSPNWLFLWLNPFCIIAAAGIWIKRCKRAVYCYQICNFAALTLLLAGHSIFGQALNTAFPLLILCDMMRSATYLFVAAKGLKTTKALKDFNVTKAHKSAKHTPKRNK